MCKIFLTLKTVYASYTYQNNPFATSGNIKDVMQFLKEVGENLIIWFSDNQIKLNPDKCHQILNTKEQITLKV